MGFLNGLLFCRVHVGFDSILDVWMYCWICCDFQIKRQWKILLGIFIIAPMGYMDDAMLPPCNAVLKMQAEPRDQINKTSQLNRISA